ncbi:diacylglycerol/lipid kinase family protein [Cnuibacter physcomitrellae]|uniref:diacylglycerol/lipid kinase family protein n=1 Tax=Cnuibacter physcomitrellae TaxID=1619308 RepID=UPI002175A077|nr:diacylglycerol kinase family protein [Cnuibacter physcomitrellae]
MDLVMGEGGAPHDEAPEPLPRAAVVVNPVKIDAKRLRTVVAAAERAAGWGETLWYETTLEDAGHEVARRAVADGAAVVMAAGGDGTVRAVAEGLRGTGVPIGLLPVGTGNLLARNLGMTLTNLEQAVTTVFTGDDHRIDLGMIDITREDRSHEQNVFLVMAGLGIDAKMIANTRSSLKKRLGWLAYVDGGIRALPSVKPVKVKAQLDGSAWRSFSAHTVIVGNCGSLPGGILLIPDARPDDGILDIVAFRPEGWFGWLKVWNKLTFENGVLRKSAVGRRIIDLTHDVRSVTYRRGHDMAVRLDEPEEIQLDGDDFGLAVALHIWIDPGALAVRVPASPTASAQAEPAAVAASTASAALAASEAVAADGVPASAPEPA